MNVKTTLFFALGDFQFTEEKLGKAERTENDPHFEDLARKTDKTKMYTEKLVKNTEGVLVPNAGRENRRRKCEMSDLS